MIWTTPERSAHPVEASCSFCGRWAPREPDRLISEGWQVRMSYPLAHRCPACRQRHEREWVVPADRSGEG